MKQHKLAVLALAALALSGTAQAQLAAPNATGISAGHTHLVVPNVAKHREIWKALGAIGVTYVVDNAEADQVIADLLDGVRIEIALDTAQTAPILFHHTHIAALDGATLHDWYVQVFGAEVGERRGLPSAVIPGGRVDFLPVRETAPAGSQGATIDYIGFEVTDMAAFKARMDSMGIAYNRGPERIDDINLTIGFISDPVGTYIEITEGLDDVE